MTETRGPDAPPKLTWEQIKLLGPTGPVPVEPGTAGVMPKEKWMKAARRCRHTRKHHTSAGGCRKCDKAAR